MYFGNLFIWRKRYLQWFLGLWMLGSWPLAHAQLDFIDIVFDGGGGVDGLAGAEVVAVSADGKNVYATGVLDNAVAVFSRDEGSGLLAFLEVHRDGVSGVDGLMGAQGIAISDDGRYLFTAGSGEDALAAFRRDTTAGTLTFLDVYRDGVGGIDGLAGPLRVVSRDETVYVTCSLDNAIALFSLDSDTGALSFVEAYVDGAGGVDGLAGALGMTIAPDGGHLYATGTGDDAVAAFERNTTTGALTFLAEYRNGVGGVIGLDDPQEIVSADAARLVFCSSFASNSVAVFRRNSQTGELSFLDAYFDGVDGVDGLSGALGIAVKPGSRQVVAMGFLDNAVAVFDLGGNDLFYAGTYRDGVMGVDGLANAVTGAWDPSGAHLYVTGFGDNAIAIFEAETTLGSLILAWSDETASITIIDLIALINGM